MAKIIIKLIVFCLFILVLSCSPQGLYNFTPYDGITIKVKLKEFKTIQKHDAILLFFDYCIENTAQTDYFFNPGRIKAKLNNTISREVWYDSLSSAELREDKLLKGKNTYKLYFVFSEEKDLSKINSFEIVDFGLRSEPEEL